MIWGAVERAYPLNAPNRKICGFAANFSEKRKGASRAAGRNSDLSLLRNSDGSLHETCDNVPHEVVDLI